ncbi:MAG: amidohydrolase [Candidatus Bathyarchaeota archaeon]|nr:MAG: amidohydrolase [Candidatus Bathyarchaeota archaeon]
MSDAKKTATDWIDENRVALICLSDQIWEFAELGLIEFKSSSLLIEQLEKHGFMINRTVSGMPTAFTATWGEGGPSVGIMGEYDALPGLSQKSIPQREPLSPGEPGHGCGHNIHGTSGLAAALATKKALEYHNLHGSIVFFGCPAEENFSGKVFMVRDGVFNGLDAVLSHHPSDMNAAEVRSSLAVNSAKFCFRGRAAHAAASPEHGRSALDACELMNVGVNFLREHVAQDVRIHYVIEKGGEQPNVVPSYARSWYYVRAPERSETEFIYEWVTEIAHGAAVMTRTAVETQFIDGCYNYLPSQTIAEMITVNMRKVGLPTYNKRDLAFAEEIAETISPETKLAQLKKTERPGWEKLADKLIDDNVPDPWGEGKVSHGSTDVADVSWQAPTIEFNTATWVLGTPAHSWQAVAQSRAGIGHKSLIFAAKTMATTAIDLLTEEHWLKRAKEEHKQSTHNKPYKPPIPKDHQPPIDIWKS